jgi:hypothetical protein
MKNFGILILVAGLSLGLYSITMDVSVSVAARDYGYGIQTPAMEVANLDKMSQRQNFMIFSGILSVVGSILLGFASMQPKKPFTPAPAEETPSAIDEHREFMDKLLASPNTPGRYSICSKCRHMGGGDDAVCTRCGVPLTA